MGSQPQGSGVAYLFLFVHFVTAPHGSAERMFCGGSTALVASGLPPSILVGIAIAVVLDYPLFLALLPRSPFFLVSHPHRRLVRFISSSSPSPCCTSRCLCWIGLSGTSQTLSCSSIGPSKGAHCKFGRNFDRLAFEGWIQRVAKHHGHGQDSGDGIHGLCRRCLALTHESVHISP